MSKLAPEAAAVVEAAARLVSGLEAGHNMLGAVLELQRLLVDLEAVARRDRERRMRRAVHEAGGLTLTHAWTLTNGTLHSVQCVHCSTSTLEAPLRRGAVPACDANARCSSSVVGHLILSVGRCLYCDTTFPATAEPEEA